jgi:hypothetical protein
MALPANEDGGPDVAVAAGPFELTAPQMAIWLDQVMHPKRPIYNTGQTLTIRTALDVDRFAAALRRTVAANDSLRLRVFQRGGRVLQEVVAPDDVEFGIDLHDVSAEADPDAAAAAWIERTFWTPLAPGDFPLFRFAVAKVAPDRFVWLQKYHHLIIDATGRRLVAARAAAIYDALSAGEVPLPGLVTGGSRSFRSAKEAEDAYLASERCAVDEAYWTARFADPPEPIVRSEMRLSERSRSGRPARLDCALTQEESDALRVFAARHGSSPFKIVVCLAWSCFSRLYVNPDLVFGVAVAGRPGPEFKGAVGLFSKVMPFRPRLDPAMTMSEALATVDDDLSEDLKHQRYPTTRVESGGMRLRRLGAYDVGINYLRSDYDFDLGGAPVTCTNLSAGFVEPWRIMGLEFGTRDSLIRILLDYDHGRVGPAEAERVFRGFRALLSGVPRIADGDAIGELPMGLD